MATIQIRPAAAGDASEIAHVHYEALATFHEFYAAFFAVPPSESVPKSTQAALADPSQNFLVAVDSSSSGAVVGFIRYHLVDNTGEEEEEKEQPKVVSSVPALFAPKVHVKELWERFCEREDEMEAVYIAASKGQRHAYVKHLMVHPNHQRKGIGKMLLEAVVAKSDAEGIPTFIVASAEAHGLYDKVGFEDLGTFRIDNGYWAKEIADLERKLGIQGNEHLAQKYDGLQEVERYMVRRVRQKIDTD